MLSSRELVLTFSQDVSPGTGNLTLRDLTDPSNPVETLIPASDPPFTYDHNVVRIDPSGLLGWSKNYAIRIDAAMDENTTIIVEYRSDLIGWTAAADQGGESGYITITEESQNPPPRLPDDVRAEQIRDLKFGMFICWSFRTFSGQEWTPTRDKDASYFRATSMDTEQWARVARDAGMSYILFLTNHHDGFCLWDTETTEKKLPCRRIHLPDPAVPPGWRGLVLLAAGTRRAGPSCGKNLRRLQRRAQILQHLLDQRRAQF